MPTAAAVPRALAAMDRRAVELVTKWRAEDAAKGVRFTVPVWPGRAYRPEPTDYWASRSQRGS